MDWLHFEIKKSRVRVITRPHVVKNQSVNSVSYKVHVGIFPKFTPRVQLGAGAKPWADFQLSSTKVI